MIGEVIPDISSNDQMLHQDDVASYLSAGRSAMTCIQAALQAAGKSTDEVKQILDLPCGHGRVLRHLRAAFPRAQISACDLLRDGVDFCASTFGATPVYSHESPSEIQLERHRFDLIWVGSLLTHLDARQWPGFLNLFRNCLGPDGLLIFSTHGREAYRRMVTGSFDYGVPYWRRTSILHGYERIGFGYADYLNYQGYGISLSAASWVVKQLNEIDELRLVNVSERSWDTHHDVFACVRDPGWPVRCPPISPIMFLKHRVREVLRPKS